MTASQEDIVNHDRYSPYDLEKSHSVGKENISFKFIADCCLEFDGSANLRGDTLKLKYWNTGKSYPCDCICDYKLTYKINQEKSGWKRVISDPILYFQYEK